MIGKNRVLDVIKLYHKLEVRFYPYAYKNSIWGHFWGQENIKLQNYHLFSYT